MTTWIQSLSWTLIYGLGQGFVVYAALWLVMKLVPALSARVKYHMSLSALMVLLAWFAFTWWQQFHLLAANNSFATSAYPFTIGQQETSLLNEDSATGYYSLLSLLKVIFPWLSVFYLVGLVLMLARLSSGMLQLFSLRSNGISDPGEKLNNLLVAMKQRLHFEGSARLFVSSKAAVPMVIGVVKPIILLPAATIAQLSTEQLETILLHELSHIKRYDYLVNILQTVVETILFFNPFVWIISGVIRREREHCCDDLVLGHTNERLSYATALATLATYPGKDSNLAIAASGRSYHLLNRIKRIMEVKKNAFSYGRTMAALLIIAVITGVVWLTPSFASAAHDKPMDPKMSVQTSAHKDLTEEEKMNAKEEEKLIQRIIADKVMSFNYPFTIEKKEGMLFINGVKQSNDITAKYLPMITREEVTITFYPYQQSWPGKDRESGTFQFVDPLVPKRIPTDEGC